SWPEPEGKRGKATFSVGLYGEKAAFQIDSTGKLSTVLSSARFKDAIKPMDNASEAILALQPVTFRYEHERDPDGIRQFGLIAEEVQKVNPDLVVRDEDEKVNTVLQQCDETALFLIRQYEHWKLRRFASSGICPFLCSRVTQTQH